MTTSIRTALTWALCAAACSHDQPLRQASPATAASAPPSSPELPERASRPEVVTPLIASEPVPAGAPPGAVVIQSAFGGAITAIAISPDGTLLASAEDYIGGLKIWDLGSGLQLRTMHLTADAQALAFLPGGGLVVACTDQSVSVFDPIEGRATRELQTPLAAGFSIVNMHPGLAVSRDGVVVAGGFARPGTLAPIERAGPGALAGVQEIFALARVAWGWGADGRVVGALPLPTEGSAAVTAAAFTPSGREVIVGLEDGDVVAWSPGGRAAPVWHDDRDDMSSGIVALVVSPDGRWIALAREDGSLSLGSTQGGPLRVVPQAKGIVGLASDHRRRLVTSDGSGALAAWDWRTGRRLGLWRLAPALSHLAALDGGRTLAVVMGQVIGLWDVEREALVRSLGGRAADIGEAVVAGGARTLLIDAGDRLTRWDIAADDHVRGPATATRELRELRAVPDGRTVLRVRRDDRESSLEAIDVTTLGTRWSKRYAGAVEDPRASPDGHHCGVLVGRARVEVMACDDGRALASFDVRQRAEVVFGFDFEPVARGFSIVTSGARGGWAMIDRFVSGDPSVQPGVETKEDGPVTNVRASPIGRHIAWSYPEGGQVKVLDMSSATVAVVAANGRTIEPSPVEPLLAIGSGDGSVVFWDMGERVVLERKRLAPSIVDRLSWSPDGRMLIAGARDGSVHLLDPRRRLATVFFAGDARLVVTDEGFYMGQPAATAAVAFRVGPRAYPFEQFDVAMHRPDLVMERLGGDDAVLAAYRSLTRERHQRMAVSAGATGGERPFLEVDPRSVPGVSRERSFVVRLEASSAVGLRALHVFVNHVPILGTRGRPLQVPAHTSWRGSERVDLLAPVSKIQIAVESTDGVQSLMETFEVAFSGRVSPGVRHVIAIGVSRYDDEAMNLRYPSKDAADIGALFGGHGPVTIIPDAKRADVVALRAALVRTAPADEVLLFVAGHGVLDDAFTYRFATADFDFGGAVSTAGPSADDPARTARDGVTFAELEALLDGIPARRRLLLMDTCHAGELGQDDVEALGRAAPGLSVRALPDTRGASARILADAPRRSVRSSLLAELFVDVRRGAGATVIAAAGGADFAFESERWQNGAFTRAVREGVGCGHADADGDRVIRVSELVAFTARRVPELTRGAQRPLARRFNTAEDFTLGAVPTNPPAHCMSER